MRITQEEKLKMCEEHIINGKSLSHVSEEHGNYAISNLKYLVCLYKKFGSSVFLNRDEKIYRRDTKLLAISRVLENKESIRSVSLDFGLTDPTVLADWIRIYKTKGIDGIQDTFPRKNYVLKDERARRIVDKKLVEENERLKAEIEYLKKSHSLTQKLEGVTNKDKAVIVTELRGKFRLKVLLEISGMSSSVYYYNVMANVIIKNKYIEIEKAIDFLYIDKHKKRLGYLRVYLELKKLGFIIGKNKVLEIMKDKKYLKIKRKKWRKYISYEGDLGWTKPNHMNRDFHTEKPYEKAGTDVTMFPLQNEPVYLSPIIDFNSREVLSYVASTDVKMDKITLMLNKLKKKHKEKIKGMMIQSDQGIQYQNSRYSEKLHELGIIQSMSRKGNCLDNAPTENFFGRMKEEMWYGQEYKYHSSEELINAIHEYINYYNNIRPVTRLKMSPIEYRNTFINLL